jgi:hypothetical protein
MPCLLGHCDEMLCPCQDALKKIMLQKHCCRSVCFESMAGLI